MVRDLLFLLGGSIALMTLGCGLFAALMLWAIKRFEGRDETERLDAARQVLAKHGLRPVLYCPVLKTADKELDDALTAFSGSGYVIVDKRQRILSDLAGPPARLPPPKEPHLHLVSSKP